MSQDLTVKAEEMSCGWMSTLALPFVGWWDLSKLSPHSEPVFSLWN